MRVRPRFRSRFREPEIRICARLIAFVCISKPKWENIRGQRRKIYPKSIGPAFSLCCRAGRDAAWVIRKAQISFCRCIPPSKIKLNKNSLPRWRLAKVAFDTVRVCRSNFVACRHATHTIWGSIGLWLPYPSFSFLVLHHFLEPQSLCLFLPSLSLPFLYLQLSPPLPYLSMSVFFSAALPVWLRLSLCMWLYVSVNPASIHRAKQHITATSFLQNSAQNLAAQKSHRKIAVTTTVATSGLASIPLQKSQSFPLRWPQHNRNR